MPSHFQKTKWQMHWVTFILVFTLFLKFRVPFIRIQFISVSLTASYVTVVAESIKTIAPELGTVPVFQVDGLNHEPLVTEICVASAIGTVAKTAQCSSCINSSSGCALQSSSICANAESTNKLKQKSIFDKLYTQKLEKDQIYAYNMNDFSNRKKNSQLNLSEYNYKISRRSSNLDNDSCISSLKSELRNLNLNID